MIKVCSACGQLQEHKSWKSYTCNECLEAGLKYCPSCEEVHGIDDFHKNGHTIRSFCKACECARSKTNKKDIGYYDRPAVKAKRLEDSRLFKQAKYLFDDEYRLKAINIAHNRRCLLSQRGKFSLNECHSTLKVFNESCAYCGATGALTQDHVIAISKGGMNNSTNIVPACTRCNCSKNNHDVIEWYIKQSFYTEERLMAIIRHIRMEGGDAICHK